jgi:acetyl-CoA carboxylase carboxyl transferase subunit alpha
MTSAPRSYLDFEKPIAELEARAGELRALDAKGDGVALGDEIEKLEQRTSQALNELYKALTPWQKTLVARHPQRPHFNDFCDGLITEFTPLAGDRKFGEDEAIVCGFGRFNDMPVCVLGQEKGATTEARIRHNFGMARPEGYRKAVRLMEMAGRFNLPVITFVDTAGAYPGIGAEERGQAEAIARSTEACLALPSANIALIIGEGGSGGAVAIATANRVMMMEHAIYSVISPEGAASILWRDSTRAQDAATGMKITAQDLKKFGVIDTIITEPPGGAHRDPALAIARAGEAIAEALAKLTVLDSKALINQRADKFLAIGRSL